jgi:stearoyl-CoA desaturase (delta-9 desaturase)
MYATELLATLHDALFDWLVHGLGSFSGWQIVAVTIFLHRSQTLAELMAMREQRRRLWTLSGASGEQLVADLQAWLKTAEASGGATLHEFAAMLRAVRA